METVTHTLYRPIELTSMMGHDLKMGVSANRGLVFS